MVGEALGAFIFGCVIFSMIAGLFPPKEPEMVKRITAQSGSLIVEPYPGHAVTVPEGETIIIDEAGNYLFEDKDGYVYDPK